MLLTVAPSASRLRGCRLAALSLATLVSLAACGSDSDTAPAAPQELRGAAVAVGNGTAYTYVVNGSNGPASIGIALTPAALQGLPATDAMWDLPLPSGVTVAPFDHAMLNWNAQGHPPEPYMVPHFDFHFYTITPSAQSAILAGPDTMTVPPQYVPQDYVSGVMAVPDMGVHWIDSTAAELHGHPFDKTFIYGFYHGNMVFVEPMVTLAYLASQPSATAAVKQPQAFAQPGRYPAEYSVRYDAATNTIRVSIDSLVAH
jgi:hypothetical protein